jgi:leader peptidase (prepilin peptidase)/N-methyltransferase
VILLIYIFVFLFGLIVGSFLNVLIYRFNTGQNITGRSHCFSCGKTLKPSHLIPVISFLWQKGKCAYCKSSIAWQYPAVELTTGLLFVLAASLATSITYFFWLVFIFSILLVITVYDLRHKIIPDLYVYLFIVSTGIVQAYLWWIGLATLPDLIIGPTIALFFASLWFFFKRNLDGFWRC